MADVDSRPTLVLRSRIETWTVLADAVVHRDGCVLPTVWCELKASTQRAGGITVTARLRSSRLDLASRILGSRLVRTTGVAGGWSHVTLSYNDIHGVRQLLQFGNHIEVPEPPEARAIVREIAEGLAERHADQ